MTNQQILSKAIPGYNDYLANSLGQIISNKYKTPRTLKPGKKPNGRLTVNLWVGGRLKTEYVHRLIASAFHGTDDLSLEVNHIDGNPQNNTPENLEWCTRSHNIRHAFRTGLNKPNIQAKITLSQVQEIRELIVSRPFSLEKIGKRYGVSRSAVKHIKSGRTWPTPDPIKYLGENI